MIPGGKKRVLFLGVAGVAAVVLFKRIHVVIAREKDAEIADVFAGKLEAKPEESLLKINGGIATNHELARALRDRTQPVFSVTVGRIRDRAKKGGVSPLTYLENIS